MQSIINFVSLFFDLLLYVLGSASNLLNVFFVFIFISGCVFELFYQLLNMEY